MGDKGRSLDEVRDVIFKIGLSGQHELDISEQEETHVFQDDVGGGTSLLWSCCASYMPASRRSSQGCTLSIKR